MCCWRAQIFEPVASATKGLSGPAYKRFHTRHISRFFKTLHISCVLHWPMLHTRHTHTQLHMGIRHGQDRGAAPGPAHGHQAARAEEARGGEAEHRRFCGHAGQPSRSS